MSGIRDVDRLMIENLSDTDILHLCATNKYFSNSVCNDDFWIKKVNAITGSDLIHKKPSKYSWKQWYFIIVSIGDFVKVIRKYVNKMSGRLPADEKKLIMSNMCTYIHENMKTLQYLRMYHDPRNFYDIIKQKLDELFREGVTECGDVLEYIKSYESYQSMKAKGKKISNISHLYGKE